jgi:small subunit ribosomal protein S23
MAKGRTGDPDIWKAHAHRPSVVQRQMWLMKHKSLSKASAYDQARREFYSHRHLSEIRSRIAKEEAQHVGAYFAKGPLEIGMELEDRSWEGWKKWAAVQIEDEQATRAQMFSGPQDEGGDLKSGEYERAVEELATVGGASSSAQAQVLPPLGVSAGA